MINTKKTYKISNVTTIKSSFFGPNDLMDTLNKNIMDNLKAYQTELKKNKALVTEFIEAMKNSDVDKLAAMITDDFSWWIIGKPEYLATAGEHDTEFFFWFFQGVGIISRGNWF